MDTTVEKSFRVLEYLVAARGPVRLSTVAQELGLQKSNAHRTLATLVAGGYVTQDEDTSLYRPSLKLFELGARVIAAHPIRSATAPYLQQLHQSLGETVNLYVEDQHTVMVVEKLLSPRPLRFSSRPGMRLPMASSAAGHIMLAYASDPEDLLEKSVLTLPPSDKVKLDRKALLSSLSKIRENGFTEAVNGWSPGIFSIAVPLMSATGVLAGVMGVSGPTERLTPESRDKIIEALRSTNALIAENASVI